MLRRQLIKDAGVGGCGYAVDGDVLSRYFFAQRLCECDYTSFSGAVGRSVWIAFFARIDDSIEIILKSNDMMLL
jgi:hypothetical protein